MNTYSGFLYKKTKTKTKTKTKKNSGMTRYTQPAKGFPPTNTAWETRSSHENGAPKRVQFEEPHVSAETVHREHREMFKARRGLFHVLFSSVPIRA